MILASAEKYKVDPEIMVGIIAAESGFDRCQISNRVKKKYSLSKSVDELTARKYAKKARKNGIKVDLGLAQFRYPISISLNNALSDSASVSLLAERLHNLKLKHKGRYNKPSWAFYSNNRFSSHFMRSVNRQLARAKSNIYTTYLKENQYGGLD